MMTVLGALISSYPLALAGGGLSGVLLETVIPMMTRAHRARKAMNALRDGYQQLHGRPVPHQTLSRIRFDPDLTE